MTTQGSPVERTEERGAKSEERNNEERKGEESVFAVSPLAPRPSPIDSPPLAPRPSLLDPPPRPRHDKCKWQPWHKAALLERVILGDAMPAIAAALDRTAVGCQEMLERLLSGQADCPEDCREMLADLKKRQEAEEAEGRRAKGEAHTGREDAKRNGKEGMTAFQSQLTTQYVTIQRTLDEQMGDMLAIKLALRVLLAGTIERGELLAQELTILAGMSYAETMSVIQLAGRIRSRRKIEGRRAKGEERNGEERNGEETSGSDSSLLRPSPLAPRPSPVLDDAAGDSELAELAAGDGDYEPG